VIRLRSRQSFPSFPSIGSDCDQILGLADIEDVQAALLRLEELIASHAAIIETSQGRGLIVLSVARLLYRAAAHRNPLIVQAFTALAASTRPALEWRQDATDVLAQCSRFACSHDLHNSNVARTLTLIDIRYRDPRFSLNQAAHRLNLSPSHLSRLVREVTGDTFSKHLAVKRIDAASALLKTSCFSVKEIASRVGFNDTACFCRRFRLATGNTPSQFRNRNDEHDGTSVWPVPTALGFVAEIT
jgi:AraC-like DNA-binding protein